MPKITRWRKHPDAMAAGGRRSGMVVVVLTPAGRDLLVRAAGEILDYSDAVESTFPTEGEKRSAYDAYAALREAKVAPRKAVVMTASRAEVRAMRAMLADGRERAARIRKLRRDIEYDLDELVRRADRAELPRTREAIERACQEIRRETHR